MDLDLTGDQQEILNAIAAIVDDHLDVPRDGNVAAARTFVYGDALEHALLVGGFFDIAINEGFGEAEAALLIHEAARSPLAVEATGSALVAPLLPGAGAFERPVAIARLQDCERGVRYLDRARTLIVDAGDEVWVMSAEDLDVETMGGVYAYPLGRLKAAPDPSRALRLGGEKVALLRRLWRVGIAAEIAGNMKAAVDFTTSYVKDRQVFSRPLGTFQAIQHRLSQDVVRIRGVYWQMMRAGTTRDPAHAAAAALHGQKSVEQVVYDCHQFNGALGMTLEHKLHYYTFRLRWLAAEMGGARAQAAALAEMTWGEAGKAAA